MLDMMRFPPEVETIGSRYALDIIIKGCNKEMVAPRILDHANSLF